MSESLKNSDRKAHTRKRLVGNKETASAFANEPSVPFGEISRYARCEIIYFVNSEI